MEGRKGGEMIGGIEGRMEVTNLCAIPEQPTQLSGGHKPPNSPFSFQSTSNLIPLNNNNNWEMPSSFLLPIFIFFTFATFWHRSFAGPVNVRIETENNQDFHIGPEPRTRFELIEQYSPLATARQVHQGQSTSRAFASSLNKVRHPIRPPKPVQLIVDFGEAGREGKSAESVDPTIGHPHQQLEANSAEAKQQFGPKVITRSQWLEWTRWTKCDNGMRMRIRKCLKINGIPCEGKSEERQKCYSAHNVGTKFGNDPMIIERELLEGRLNKRI